MTPSSFANTDIPLVVVPENIPGDLFTISVEVMQVDGRPFMRVVDKESGEEFLIPEQMFKAIEREGKVNFRQARLELSVEQCAYSNIENTFPELKLSDKLSTDSAPCYSLEDDTFELIEGTALLRFLPDMGQPETKNGSRWALFLKDYNKSLSSVPWNDIEGIRQIVNRMKDPEALNVQLALADAEAGLRLTNNLRIRELAKEFKETLASAELPEVLARKVSKALRSDAQIKTLIKHNRSGMKDMIRTVYVEREGIKIPIALEVKFSHRYSEKVKEDFEKRILEITGWNTIPLSKQNDNKLAGNDNNGYRYKLVKGFWITPSESLSMINRFADALPTTARISDAKSWL